MSTRIHGHGHFSLRQTTTADPLQGVGDKAVSEPAGVKPTRRQPKRGISDFEDAFEPALQNSQPNSIQGTQSPNPSQQPQKIGAAENKGQSSPTQLPRWWPREYMDENGYKWTSFMMIPPHIRDAAAIDPDNPDLKKMMDQLSDLAKEVTSRVMSKIQA